MSKSQDAPSTICKVSVAQLAAGAQPGEPMDESSSKLLDQELKTLKCRRIENELEAPSVDERERNGEKRVLRTDLTGIALSGGGIRSATFGLGVLQALAKAGLLKRFDYLSTVSGGGYIGSSLSWWLSDASARNPQARRPPFGLKRDDFPYGANDAANVDPRGQPKDASEAGPRLLDYLRNHGNYLTPGEGISFWSGVSVAIRAMFLNLFVWIPLITAGFLVLYWLPRILFPYSVNYPPYRSTLPVCSSDDRVTDCLSSIVNEDIVQHLSIGGLGMSWQTVKSILIDAALICATVLVIVIACVLVCFVSTKCCEFAVRRVPKLLGAWWFWIPVIVVSSAVALLYAVPLSGRSSDPGTTALMLVLIDAGLIALILLVSAYAYYLLLFDRNDAPNWLGARWWVAMIGVSSAAILLHAPPALPPGFQRYWLLILAAIMAGTFGLLCLIYSLLSYILSKSSVWFEKPDDADQKFDKGTARRFARLAKVREALASGCRAGARGGREFGYEMRRLFERWAGVYLFVFAGLLVLGSVPVVAEWWGAPAAVGAQPAPSTPGPGIVSGLVALLSGLATTIVAFYRSGVQVGERLRVLGFEVLPGGFAATLAAALLLFGVLVVSHRFAVWALSGEISVTVASVVLVAAVVWGFFVNANHVSLGRFYRDRLLEAFMPSYDAAIDGRTGAAPQAADRMRLFEASSAAPYHIINTNVVLVSTKDRRRRLRGGDSFILTRDYCGSNATGWRITKEFMAGRMTVPTAMAISGAAANPNTGVGGVGLTRSKVISALMALVNLRLGHWVPHPIRGNLRGKQNAIPNHFRPGFTSFFIGHTEHCRFQELTDGGHFDNLGIYELIRRRVHLILVCDAAADPDFQFGDLQMALHRIKEDFGATIEFCASYGIEDLIPEKGEGTTYPKGLEQAKRGFAVAKIHYASELGPDGKARPDARPAWLVYLKSTIVPGLPLELRGYRGREALFPNQSTGDQFFDEDQFEAYRQLGQQLADAMIKQLHLDQGLPKDQSVPPGDTCGTFPDTIAQITEQVHEAIEESADGKPPARQAGLVAS